MCDVHQQMERKCFYLGTFGGHPSPASDVCCRNFNDVLPSLPAEARFARCRLNHLSPIQQCRFIRGSSLLPYRSFLAFVCAFCQQSGVRQSIMVTNHCPTTCWAAWECDYFLDGLLLQSPIPWEWPPSRTLNASLVSLSRKRHSGLRLAF